MNRSIKNTFALISALLVLCGNTYSQDNKKVLIIGIDGCRPDALALANTPIIDNLISTSIYSPDALNDDITISGPGWSAILCGVRSEKHLVTNNDLSNNDYENYPSIFKIINEVNSDFHTVSICHWGPINDNIVQDEADFKLSVGTDAEVAQQASDYISVNDPDLIFLHFDDADHAGHANGFSPEVPEYIDTIEDIDTHIGSVISAIESRSTYLTEDWTIIVTTDHGGLNNSHGGNSIEERRVFLIISNKNLQASTINKVINIEVDSVLNCLGSGTYLSFDGNGDIVSIAPDSIFDMGTDRDFTVECRIRSDASGDYSIVGNKDWESGNNKGFVFSYKFPSGPEWKINIGDGTNRADINTGGDITDNEWYTLSVSFNRDGQMKMYQDGTLLDSTDISYIGDISTYAGIKFGADIFNNFDFNGRIAEVRLWDTVITGATIEEWYCNSLDIDHPNSSQLLGYWKMNEGTGIDIIDYSDYKNNGTIEGAQWSNSDTLYIDDYSQTPRLVDVVPTVLAHLCIEVDPNWELEGTSLLPECTTISSNSDLTSDNNIILYPNPTKDKLIIDLNDSNFNLPLKLKLYDQKGALLYKRSITESVVELNLSTYFPGIYLLSIGNEKSVFTKKIVKQ